MQPWSTACFMCLEKLQNGRHSGKKYLIFWSIEKISSTCAGSFLLENSPWGELPHCGECSLLYKLPSCFLLRRDILNRSCKVSLIWNHSLRHCIYFIVLIFNFACLLTITLELLDLSKLAEVVIWTANGRTSSFESIFANNLTSKKQ